MPRARNRLLRDLPDESLPESSQFLNAVEWFSGPRKRALREFITYWRGGGFTVW